MQDQEQSELTDQQLATDEEIPDASDEECVDEQPPLEDYPEEETPDEEEEPPGAKYRVGNAGGSGGAFAAVGDHARMVNINYILQVTREAGQGMEEQVVPDRQEDGFQGDLYQLIASALASTRRSEMFPVHASPGGGASSGEPASAKVVSQWTDEEIAGWYYALQGYEQCYVQAVAALHGAVASEISRRADGLYVLFKMEQEHHEAPSQQADQAPARTAIQVSLPPSLHDRASAILYQRTHTFTQRVDGVERLFWSDVDTYGQSVFGLRFLDFLARELLSKGEHGRVFLERLEHWSFEGQEECRLFAARALGIFLWRQDVAALCQKAAKWAKNRSLSGWRRTAMLLNGAYDIDCLNQRGREKPGTSCVLALLQIWRERGQKLSATSSQADMFVRCAAAHTYELMGKHAPQIAMQGLEQLMLSISPEAKQAQLLVASVVSAYVSLSWSGHLEAVLGYLAQIAEQVLRQPNRPATFRQRLTYQQQCKVKLEVALDTFFFIAATALAEGAPVDPQASEQPLARPTVFPDRPGRDVILAGLIAPGAHCWSEPLVVLLAAAIMEKKRRYRSPAFDLLREWMRTVPQESDDEGEALSLLAFRQFLLRLDATLELWYRDLKERGSTQLPAHLLYRKQLQRWAKHTGPISTLALDVLTLLPSPVWGKSEQLTR
jgi:hypothetical protein